MEKNGNLIKIVKDILRENDNLDTSMMELFRRLVGSEESPKDPWSEYVDKINSSVHWIYAGWKDWGTLSIGTRIYIEENFDVVPLRGWFILEEPLKFVEQMEGCPFEDEVVIVCRAGFWWEMHSYRIISKTWVDKMSDYEFRDMINFYRGVEIAGVLGGVRKNDFSVYNINEEERNEGSSR